MQRGPEGGPRSQPVTSAVPVGGGHRFLVYGLLLLLFIIWSNSFHSIAHFRQRLAVSAPDLVSLRYGPVVPFCLGYCLLHWRRFRRLWEQEGWKILLVALFAVPGYNLTLNWGQGRVPPATASLLIATNPVFTYVLAIAFLRERWHWAKAGGMFLSFLGVYALVHVQQGQFGAGYVRYALVVLVAPLSWALASVIGKPVTERHDPLLFTFAATGIGSLPFLVGLVAGTGEVHAALGALDLVGWAALVHLSLLCTVIGFAIWFWALRHLPASSVAAFVFLNPPLTLLFGFYWGTERFHWSTVVFGLVTLFGVALSSGVLQRQPALHGQDVINRSGQSAGAPTAYPPRAGEGRSRTR